MECSFSDLYYNIQYYTRCPRCVSGVDQSSGNVFTPSFLSPPLLMAIRVDISVTINSQCHRLPRDFKCAAILTNVVWSELTLRTWASIISLSFVPYDPMSSTPFLPLSFRSNISVIFNIVVCNHITINKVQKQNHQSNYCLTHLSFGSFVVIFVWFVSYLPKFEPT